MIVMNKINNIAVLLTCFNRKKTTDACLESFFSAIGSISNYTFDIFLVDDASKDGTTAFVNKKYPMVNTIEGDGKLYWAGGMSLAWRTALNSDTDYDGYLLINDDVHFYSSFWTQIDSTIKYSKQNYGCVGICILSTIDDTTGLISYGGYKLANKLFKHRTLKVLPLDIPQECQLANANILYIPAEVVNRIGILDPNFTHSLADFDYTLTAYEKGIPVLVGPNYGGVCVNDHPNKIIANSIKQRIANLYDIKGLALNEYLYYLKKHFWWKAPYAFLIHWIQAIAPYLITNSEKKEYQ